MKLFPSQLLLPLLSLLLLLAAQHATCLSSSSNSSSRPHRGRVLALLPHPSQRFSRFSRLFSAIEARGYEVVARSADDPGLRLREWDSWLWDKVVVIPEEKDLGGAVDAGALLEFLSSGRDLLVALSPASSPDLRALAEALGADAEPQGSSVLSPAACADGDPGFVLADASGAPAAVVGRTGKSSSSSSPSDVVAFPRTTAFTLPRPPAAFAPGIGAGVASAGATPRAFAIAVADEAAFSTAGPASADAPLAAGRALALAVGVQALSGGRAVLSGSADALSDEVAEAMRSDGKNGGKNAAFVSAVSAWAFKDAGALRASAIRHALLHPLSASLNGGSDDAGHRWGDAPYRIGDFIKVEVDVLEADGRGGWRPFEIPRGDELQVEYRMLDPFVRAALRPTSNKNGTFEAVIKAPDVYGVFKLAVHYVRPGLTPLHAEAVAPLRPFRHDEFDRFLMAAAPYYATLASVSVAFFAVVGVAMYSE